MIQQRFLKEKLTTVTVMRSLVVIALFFLPFSGFITTKCLFIALLLSLFVGDWKRRWAQVTSLSLNYFTFGLLVLLTVGIFYSAGSWHFRLQEYSRYLKLLYLPFLMPFFTSLYWRKAAIVSFISSTFLMVIYSYFQFFMPDAMAELTGSTTPLVNLIDEGFLAAIAGFFSLNLYYSNKNRMYLLGVMLVLIYLLFISQQRTGYLMVFALSGVMLWQEFRWKGVLAAFITLPSVATLLYVFLPQFQMRVSGLFSGIFQNENHLNQISSAQRMGFAKYSLEAIRSKYLVGYGTGSFREVYAKTGGPALGDNLLSHPHNEYLLILFQLGAIGLLVFLGWLLFQWINTQKLPLLEQRLAQGLIVAFVLLGVCNASLYVYAAGTATILLLAVLFGSTKNPSEA